MGAPFFVRELPDTEFQDDGLVFVKVRGLDLELATTMPIYRRFLQREWDKLNAWDQRNRDGAGAQIVKLSERGPLFLKEG